MKPSLWVRLFSLPQSLSGAPPDEIPFGSLPLPPSVLQPCSSRSTPSASLLPAAAARTPPQNSSCEAAWQRRSSISRAALGGCVLPQRDLRLLLGYAPPSAQWLQPRTRQTPLLPSSLSGLVRSAGLNQVPSVAPGGCVIARPSVRLLPSCSPPLAWWRHHCAELHAASPKSPSGPAPCLDLQLTACTCRQRWHPQGGPERALTCFAWQLPALSESLGRSKSVSRATISRADPSCLWSDSHKQLWEASLSQRPNRLT